MKKQHIKTEDVAEVRYSSLAEYNAHRLERLILEAKQDFNEKMKFANRNNQRRGR